MASASNIWKPDNLQRVSNVSLECYKHDIQFYAIEVAGIMNLEDLKALGIERLTILRIVKEMATTNEAQVPEKCCRELIARLREQKLESFADLFDSRSCNIDDQERRWARWRDHVSHNAVHMAFSENPDRLFELQQAEEKLLKWRLTTLNDKDIIAFMRIHNIQYPMVNEDERIYLQDPLTALMNDPTKFYETIFYKVPYIEVLDLIAQHRVHLISGVAYLTTPLLRSVISYHFHCHLEMQIKSLKGSYRKSGDPRVHDLIDHLQKVHKPIESAWKSGITRIEDLDALAVTSYPPCMRKLHEALRANHHLRNQGRVQYTIFLKSIGVTVESAIEFYRNEFTRNMNENAFQKEYIYNIRHLYGLVGGKKNYQLNDCSKIASYPVGDNEYHGCPFALGDMEDLDKMLIRWKIPSTRRSKIAQLTSDKKFGEACSTYFEGTHGCCVGCPIVYPIDFYGKSREICNSGRNIQLYEESDEESIEIVSPIAYLTETVEDDETVGKKPESGEGGENVEESVAEFIQVGALTESMEIEKDNESVRMKLGSEESGKDVEESDAEIFEIDAPITDLMEPEEDDEPDRIHSESGKGGENIEKSDPDIIGKDDQIAESMDVEEDDELLALK